MKSSKAFDDVIHYLEKIIIDGSEIDYIIPVKVQNYMSSFHIFQMKKLSLEK